MLDADCRDLVSLAEAAIRSGLERQPLRSLTAPTSAALTALGATFVTLERDSRLLGCIGTVEAVRPLYEDLMQNAYRSAFADPRLPAITGDDYEAMSLKVSVLSRLSRLAVFSRDEFLSTVRPDVDGVLVSCGRHRSTFLPSVWPKVASPDEFVTLLLRKAGLPAFGWPPGLSVWRYETEEFGSPGPRDRVTINP